MKHVPNILTVLRLIAVPVVVVLLVQEQWVWALVVFTIAAISDLADGYLARRWKVVSNFGKLMDPIADKALILSCLVTLWIMDSVPWWPVVILLIRELGVTVGRLLVAKDQVIAASAGGKAKTAAQVGAVFFLILGERYDWSATVGWWFLLVATVLAVWSGIGYAKEIARVRAGAAANRS